MKTEPPKRKGRKILIGFVVLAILVAAEETWRMSYSSTQANAERLSDFALPPVPDAENFFKTPFLLANGYGRGRTPALSAFEAGGKGINSVPWKKVNLVAVQNELWANGRFALAQKQSAVADVMQAVGQIPEVEELRRAAKRQYSQCDAMLDPKDDTKLPNFVTLRYLFQLFTVSASAELATGRSEIAANDARVIGQLINGLHGNPTLVAAMIRVAGSACLLQVFLEGWNEQKWSDAQLAAFESDFSSLNLVADVDRALRAEPVIVEESYRRTKSGATKSRSSFGPPFENPFVRTLGGGWVSLNFAAYRNIVRKDCYGCVDVTNAIVFPDRCKKGIADVHQFLASYSPFKFVAAIAIPNYDRAFTTTAKNQSLVNEAAIVCALERFKHAQGHYPAALDELVPRYISSLPKDPIDGNALHYRLEKGDFVLYSIGWNEKDDGGAPGTNDETGDWVWGK